MLELKTWEKQPSVCSWKGKKNTVLKAHSLQRVLTNPGPFFNEWNLFPVLLTWFTHVYGKLSHEEESCRKPRRETRCPELLASDTSKEMSRVKRSIKERKQSVMGKGRQTRTQERGQAWRGIIIIYHTFLATDWQTGLFLHLPYESKSLHTLSWTFPSTGWP